MFVKHGGVMPKKVIIRNGPSFNSFMFCSNMFGSPCNLLNFQLGNSPRSPGKETQLGILYHGKLELGDDENEYNFVGVSQELKTQKKPDGGWESAITRTFYIGIYNTRTRTGSCVTFTKEEFLATDIGKALLGKFDSIQTKTT